MATTNWTGNTSTDWSDPLNWDNGAPSSLLDVVIGTTVRSPTIPVNTPWNVLSLTINGTDTLTFGDNTTTGNSTFLTATNGVTIGGGGAIIGQGQITGNITVNGTATIGVLAVNAQNTPQFEIFGTITDAGHHLTLSVGNDSNSNPDELILTDVSAANAVDFNGGTGHLVLQEAGHDSSLTVNTQMDVGTGTVFLAGAGAFNAILTDTNGITLAGGSIFGVGKVDGNITGTGTIEASGGTLELVTAIANSAGPSYQIDDGATNILQVDAAVGTGNTFTFLGTAGELGLGNDTGFDNTISGLNEGAGGAQTNFIDIEGKPGITAAGSGTTTSGTINLSDGTVLHLTNITNLSATWFANTVSDGNGGTDVYISDAPCYCRGTLILTDKGEVLVEDLAIGDKVITLSGSAKPIHWIGHRAYDGRFVAGNRAVLPIRVAAGALADGVPARDLLVSPGHALYINGVLVPAEQLVNGATITQESEVDRVEYFHIELEAHDIVFADGAPAESYLDCDNRGKFHNAGEFARLYPDDERPRWQYCAPLLEWESPELDAIRARLMGRAGALGHRLDLNPDLHLVVDGTVIEPAAVDGHRYRFVVSAGAANVALASRTVVPAETRADARDRRRLGVPVERLVLYDPDLYIDVGHGHKGLGEGFHDDEATHRWTDGRARLPEKWLRSFPGEFTLEVHLVASDMPYRLPHPSRIRAAA